MMPKIISFCIYALKEPDSDVVRYIGLTSDLKTRFRQHKKCYKRNRVNSWIISLKAKCLLPELELIEENIMTLEEAQLKEKHYIKLFKSFGARLTNLTYGGEGTIGIIRTQEYREKLRKAVTGFRHTEETKRIIAERTSLAAKGKKKTITDKLLATWEKMKGKPNGRKGIKLTEKHRMALKKPKKFNADGSAFTAWNKDKKLSESQMFAFKETIAKRKINKKIINN